MSYEAFIVRVKNVRNHPNADRVNLCDCLGYQTIIGKDIEEGTLGIFFPTEGQLSHDHCMANNLYRKHPETQESMGGYFEPNRRVRVMKFRGEDSDGFWQPLESLSWTGADLKKLKEDMSITSLNNQEICCKYVSPKMLRTLRHSQQSKIKTKSSLKTNFKHFFEHYDTKHLQKQLHSIPKDSIISITSKLHGTSQRTGRLLKTEEVPNFRRDWRKCLGKGSFKNFFLIVLFNISVLFLKVKKFFVKPKRSWEYVSGTRRTELTYNRTFQAGKDQYRKKFHDQIVEKGLHKGETIYYEVIGYNDTGSPLMGSYGIKNKQVKKIFKTDKMIFSYGCGPVVNPHEMFVYRITRSNEDGDIVELEPWQIEQRCEELGLKTVPNLSRFIYDGDQEALMELCKKLANGPSVLDKSHLEEGVVLRISHKDYRGTALKFKGYYYRELEDMALNDDEFVDLEEIS